MGLGIEFLKHIERTRVLCHLLDAGKYENCLEEYDAIREELGLFNPDMLVKKEIIVLTKCDLLDDEMVEDLIAQLERKTGKKVYPISAPIGEGLIDLQNAMLEYAPKIEKTLPETDDAPVVIDIVHEKDPNEFEVTEEEKFTYRVTGERIEQIVRMTPMSNPEAVDRVWDVMKKRKILNSVLKQLMQSLPEEERSSYNNIDQSDHIWFTIPGKILIEDAVFHFRDFR